MCTNHKALAQYKQKTEKGEAVFASRSGMYFTKYNMVLRLSLVAVIVFLSCYEVSAKLKGDDCEGTIYTPQSLSLWCRETTS